MCEEAEEEEERERHQNLKRFRALVALVHPGTNHVGCLKPKPGLKWFSIFKSALPVRIYCAVLTDVCDRKTLPATLTVNTAHT